MSLGTVTLCRSITMLLINIDRWPDNNGNYGPNNFRICSVIENSRNKRNNRLLEFNGKMITLAEAGEISPMRSSATVARRLMKGYSTKEAILLGNMDCSRVVRSKDQWVTRSQLGEESKLKFKGKPQNNLIGKRFGRLLVEEFDHINVKRHKAVWKCKCDCGKYKLVPVDYLTAGDTQSCGCLYKDVSRKKLKTYRDSQERPHNFKDLSGKKFGDLLVINIISSGAGCETLWLVACSLGHTNEYQSVYLRTSKNPQCKECRKDFWGSRYNTQKPGQGSKGIG